jgi:hypothetical protein
MGSKP